MILFSATTGIFLILIGILIFRYIQIRRKYRDVKKFNEFAWHIGITRRPSSRRAKPSSTSVIRPSIVMPPWPRIAPLGAPVVPEV